MNPMLAGIAAPTRLPGAESVPLPAIPKCALMPPVARVMVSQDLGKAPVA